MSNPEELQIEHEKDLLALEQEIEGWKSANRILKARMEIAHKALEEANIKLGKISSKDFTNGELRYEAATLIQEALQQLRS